MHLFTPLWCSPGGSSTEHEFDSDFTQLLYAGAYASQQVPPCLSYSCFDRVYFFVFLPHFSISAGLRENASSLILRGHV